MAPTDETALLSITTSVADRKHIVVDGSKYYLASTDDISLKSIILIEQLVEWLGGLGDAISDDDAERVNRELRGMVRMLLLDMPDEIFDLISDRHCLGILMAFYEATPSEVREAAIADVSKRAKRGGASSRGSLGSTAARRKAG
jgi:hypothetical protein